MPYPAQVTLEKVIDKARELIEQQGSDALSLNTLAAALGIKAPSLYRYFENKAALLRAVNIQTLRELTNTMREAVDAPQSDEPRKAFLALARAYHDYAQAHPQAYVLAYGPLDPKLQPSDDLRESLVLPLQAAWEAVYGPEQSLSAIRGLWALLHGFTILEINGQFRRGGDLEQAYLSAVECYLNGWSRS